MSLNTMRNGIFSKIFLGILVLGAGGLVLTDWGGFFRGGVTKTDVAKVNGHQIKIAEFDHKARRIVQSQGMTMQTAYKAGFIDQILQQEIIGRLLHDDARAKGLIVDDKIVAKQLNTLLAPSGGDKKQALQQILQSQGLSESELVEMLRNDLAINALKQTVSGGAYIPKTLAARLAQLENEKRQIEFVTIPYSSVKDIKAPDDKTLAGFYDTVKSQYQIPETRDVTVGILNPTELVKGSDVTDEEARKQYDSNKDAYKVPEIRTLQQAVLKTQKEASDVLEKAKATKDLKTAVQNVTGDEKAYTGENRFEQNGLTDALAKPVFTAKEGDFIGPLQSPLGWHVIYVKAIQKEGSQPFESVAEKIKDELHRNKINDQAYDLTTAIEDRLAAGDDLVSLQDEYKLKIVKLNGLKKTDKDQADLKPYAEDEAKIIASAFATNESEASPLSDMKGGLMYTVRVEKVHPAAAKDLSLVKAEVAQKYRDAETRKKLMVQSIKLSDELDKGKARMDSIAKSFGTTSSSATISKTTTAADLDANDVTRIMAADATKSLVLPKDKEFVIVQVRKVIFPDISAASATDQKTLEGLKEDRFITYVSGLEEHDRININRSLLDRAYGAGNADDQSDNQP